MNEQDKREVLFYMLLAVAAVCVYGAIMAWMAF